MADDAPTAWDLTKRSHSYRNFDPREFVAALEAGETDADLRSALSRIEGGRFYPMLEHLSKFFMKLDADEQRDYTRRNPDLVMWMSVYNRVNDYNPYETFYELADALLIGPNRTMRPDAEVPPFARSKSKPDRPLHKDLAYRRRSYRNFSPEEIMDVADAEGQSVEINRGLASDLHMYDAEIRNELEPRFEADSKNLARQLLSRIEAGRLKPLLKDIHNVVHAFDSDEKTLFTRRNPGAMQWVSVWAFTEDQIWGDQLVHLSDVDYPFLETVSQPEHIAPTIPELREIIRRGI